MEEVVTKLDLRKISGIQYNLEEKEITGAVFMEIDSLRGLVSYLSEEALSNDENFNLGRATILTWLDRRLEGLRIHLLNISRQGKEQNEGKPLQ